MLPADAVVFAEPAASSGPGLFKWTAIILGPPKTVYEARAFQLAMTFSQVGGGVGVGMCVWGGGGGFYICKSFPVG